MFDALVRAQGTPAEEAEGGKINLIKAGAFNESAFAMMVHPIARDNIVYASGLAMQEVQAHFHGRNAHAAGEPWEGLVMARVLSGGAPLTTSSTECVGRERAGVQRRFLSATAHAAV